MGEAVERVARGRMNERKARMCNLQAVSAATAGEGRHAGHTGGKLGGENSCSGRADSLAEKAKTGGDHSCQKTASLTAGCWWRCWTRGRKTISGRGKLFCASSEP